MKKLPRSCFDSGFWSDVIDLRFFLKNLFRLWLSSLHSKHILKIIFSPLDIVFGCALVSPSDMHFLEYIFKMRFLLCRK